MSSYYPRRRGPRGGGAANVQEAVPIAHSSHGGHSMTPQMMQVARAGGMSNLPGYMPLQARTNLYGVPNAAAAAVYQGFPVQRGPTPQQQQQQQQIHPPQPVVPQHPNVTLKNIPFYEVEGVLLKPTSLLPNPATRESACGLNFYIPPAHADAICFNRECVLGKPHEYLYQVQMRFCVNDTNGEQDDIFPPGIAVKVNNKQVSLPTGPVPVNKPATEMKRPPRPVNISSLCKLCPSVSNSIQLTWTPDYTRGVTYVVGVWCVKKLTAGDLLDKLKAKGARPVDATVKMIKEKLKEDDDIATTELRVSLLCPLGKMMMINPVRPVTCTHLQCFDASVFLSMNEKKPTWSCPVCNKPALYDNLVIDSYFVEVVTSPSLPKDCNEVVLNKDGTWSAHDPSAKKKAAEAAPKLNESVQEINDLDSDADDSSSGLGSSVDQVKNEDDSSGPKTDANGKVVLVDLTCSDSEDEAGPSKAPPKSAPPPPPAAAASKEADGPSNGSAHRSSPGIIMLDSPSPPPREPTPPMPPAPVPAAPLQRPPSTEQRSPYAHLMPQQAAHPSQMQPAPPSSPYPPPGVMHPTYHQVHQQDHPQMPYQSYMPPSYDSRYHPY